MAKVGVTIEDENGDIGGTGNEIYLGGDEDWEKIHSLFGVENEEFNQELLVTGKKLVKVSDDFGWDYLILLKDNRIALPDRNSGVTYVTSKPVKNVDNFIEKFEKAFESDEEYANGGGVGDKRNSFSENMIEKYTNSINLEKSQLQGLEINSSEYNRRIQNIKEYEREIAKHYRKMKMAHGGGVEYSENKEMVLNNNKQISHHTKELPNAVKGKNVPAWVVAKVNRSASDLSDATHYLEGENKMKTGGGVGDKKLGVSGRQVKNALFYYWSNKEKNESAFWKERGEYNIGEMVEMASEQEKFGSLTEETIEKFAEEFSKNKYAKGSTIEGGKYHTLGFYKGENKAMVFFSKSAYEFGPGKGGYITSEKYTNLTDKEVKNMLPEFMKEFGLEKQSDLLKEDFKYAKGTTGVQSFVDDFILDDIDWDNINKKSELMAMAKEIVVSNLEEYGIVKFENLSKSQQNQIKTAVNEEWASYKDSGSFKNSDEGMGRMKTGGGIADDKYVAVHVSKDGYWTIASKPTYKGMAVLFKGSEPKNETFKVVTLEEALNHKKVVGREYLMKTGGGIGWKHKQYAKGSTIDKKKKTDFTISEYIKIEREKLREHNAKAHEDDRLDWSDWKSELTNKDTKEYGIYYNSRMLDSNGDRGAFEYLPENKNYREDEYAKGSTVKGGEYKFGYDITLKKHTSKNGTDIELRQNPKTKYYTIFINGFGGTSTPTEFLHVAEDDYKYELSKYESLEKRGVFAKGSTVKGKAKWNLSTSFDNKNPGNMEGYWENYGNITHEDKHPKNNDYKGLVWNETTTDGEGYWGIANKKMANGSTIDSKGNDSHCVVFSGGSIGSSVRSGDYDRMGRQLMKTFSTQTEAKDYAKRRNEMLSPGEKSYYKMKYTACPYIAKNFTKK